MMKDVFANYIAGEWRQSADSIANVNPSDTTDQIGLYSQASSADIDDAVEAARAAQPLWAALGLEARVRALTAIGDEMRARADELGELLAREEGKPRAEGIGEVQRAGQFFQYYGAEVLRLPGDFADSVRPGIEVTVSREPVGVVAVVSPWNFPTATASWKIAPALAFGNSILWKPANLTPASAWALAEIISRQGLPPGTFNLVMGSGSGAGDALVRHPQVRAVSFTGSVATGRRVAAASMENMARIQLEMGSKNALVVMDDADLKLALSCALNGAYSSCGQKCTASSRLIVHEKVHDAFVEGLAAALKDMKVGHALAAGTQLGPIVSDGQLASNIAYIELAQSEGCQLVWGGGKLEMATPGHYMEPALFVGGDNSMRVNREEMFAPIACVLKVGSYEEGLAATNDTDFGLTSGIVTRSLARAAHFRRHAESGCVMVNLPTAGTDYHVPFGGRKDSSHGPREQGRYAAEFYTQVKTAYIQSGEPQ